jgi:hypothetical protein
MEKKKPARQKKENLNRTVTVQGDFGDVEVAYPSCTLYVTSKVTLSALDTASAIQATIELYKPTEGLSGLLLTVWNSAQKPKPQTRTIKLGRRSILAAE